MRHRFIIYLICVTLAGSLMSWGNLVARASGGRGSGTSWFTSTGGGGHYYGGGSGGGFAGSVGGGHK